MEHEARKEREHSILAPATQIISAKVDHFNRCHFLKKWCEDFNCANHALELITKKKELYPNKRRRNDSDQIDREARPLEILIDLA